MKPLSQAPTRRSCPQVERLEGRDVPSATHLGVVLPAGPVTAGQDVTVTLTALDAAGKVAADYVGTVQLTSSDTAAQLPAAYTFTAADAGTHNFTVQLQTAGTPSVLAADTADGTITGSATVTVVPAAVDHFGVQVAAATVGQPAAVTVTAQDAFGNTVPTYAGTAHFTATDAGATLPADHAFVATDNGTFTTNVTLMAAGSQTITVTDAAGLTGSAAVTVAPAAVTHFKITGPASVSVGGNDTVTITALDASGNVATNYTGTAVLTLTDAQGNAASDPVTHTFSAADAGTATITLMPQERGALTLTAADQATPSAVGTLSQAATYPTANDNYIDALFQQLLGHAPAYADLLQYNSMLNQGVSRQSVALAIEATPEFQTAEVTALYQNLLGRAPDPQGLNAFVSALGSGWSIDDVAAAMLGSDEYYQLHGSGTSSGFVTALYHDVLQRAPDAAGLAGWVGMLDNGVSRGQVAGWILQSAESDRQSVVATYTQFLGHAPDQSSLTGFVLLQRNGMKTTDLYAAILGSDEYYQLAQVL